MGSYAYPIQVYRLSEITIPQLTSLQSDAGAMRLARRLDCRYGVFQSVGRMHIRHPSCRYGVLCVRRGCPQVPVRVALGDGPRKPEGCLYGHQGCRRIEPTVGEERERLRRAPERRRRERIATGLLRTGTGLPRWCIRLARRRSCCARLRLDCGGVKPFWARADPTRRSRGQPPRNGGAPLRLRTAPPRNGTAPLRLRTAPPQNGAAPLRLRTAPPQNRAARLQTRTVPLQSRTSSPQNRGRPEPLPDRGPPTSRSPRPGSGRTPRSPGR